MELNLSNMPTHVEVFPGEKRGVFPERKAQRAFQIKCTRGPLTTVPGEGPPSFLPMVPWGSSASGGGHTVTFQAGADRSPCQARSLGPWGGGVQVSD